MNKQNHEVSELKQEISSWITTDEANKERLALKDGELKALAEKCASLLIMISEQQDLMQQAQDGIDEAIVQLKYLDERFPTGTTPSVVSRLEVLITKLNQPAEEAGKDEK